MSSESNFTRLTMNFGLALIMIGVIGFAQTLGKSMTALIPAAFGFAELGLGFFAKRSPNLKKHINHFALLLALLLFFATVRSIPQLFALLQGTELDRPKAVMSMALSSIASLIYLIIGVRSFIAARKARTE